MDWDFLTLNSSKNTSDVVGKPFLSGPPPFSKAESTSYSDHWPNSSCLVLRSRHESSQVHGYNTHIYIYILYLYYIICYSILLYYIISYYILFYSIVLYYIIFYHIILYYIMLYYVMLCHIISYHIILYIDIDIYCWFIMIQSSFLAVLHACRCFGTSGSSPRKSIQP